MNASKLPHEYIIMIQKLPETAAVISCHSLVVLVVRVKYKPQPTCGCKYFTSVKLLEL